MDAKEIIEQSKRIINDSKREELVVGALAEAREITRKIAGEKSAFYRTLLEVDHKWSASYIGRYVADTLKGFIRYVENDLLDGISIVRKARVDVVSDFLGQAQTLLESKGVHPAAPAVLIGASLEEFLRNWVEEAGLSIGTKKPGIDAYANTLREADLISKQDIKDIVSWGGIRNHAAHGEWDEVSDRNRINIMLEGVNLFMRRYTV